MSLKSIAWEPSCSTRTDRRTDMTKLTVVFRNFVNAPIRVRFNCYKVYQSLPFNEFEV